MSSKEINGQYRYDRDSKRFHRFKVEAEEGIVGTIYVPKDNNSIPEKLSLIYTKKNE